MNSVMLSLVIPVYNEELAIPYLRESIEHFRAQFPMSTEVILVDDGSSDQTLQLLELWADNSRNIVIKKVDRNSGHQLAMRKGLEIAKGDFVVTMDADLQDPVDTIFDLVEKYKQGFEIVHARRIARAGESNFRKAAAWTYYRMVKMFNSELLTDVGDFRLISKKALQHYLSSQSRVFMRGEIIKLPFEQAVVNYRRQPRIAGVSKFSLRKLFALAWMGLRSSLGRSKVSNPKDEKAPVS